MMASNADMIPEEEKSESQKDFETPASNTGSKAERTAANADSKSVKVDVGSISGNSGTVNIAGKIIQIIQNIHVVPAPFVMDSADNSKEGDRARRLESRTESNRKRITLLLISVTALLSVLTWFYWLPAVSTNWINAAENTFYAARNSEEQIEGLTKLLNFPGWLPYDGLVSDRALQMFSTLSTEEQKVLFLNYQGDPESLRQIVSGVSAALADVDPNHPSTPVLAAMIVALDANPLPAGEDDLLRKEINAWVEARQLSQREELIAAIQKYQTALELDPGNPAIRFDQGMVFVQLEQYEQSLIEFEKALPGEEANWAEPYRQAINRLVTDNLKMQGILTSSASTRFSSLTNLGWKSNLTAGMPALEIRLSWSGPADLDLWVAVSGRQIYSYKNHSDGSGSLLEDANPACNQTENMQPFLERFVWDNPSAPTDLEIKVHRFQSCKAQDDSTPFEVVVIQNGQQHKYTGNLLAQQRESLVTRLGSDEIITLLFSLPSFDPENGVSDLEFIADGQVLVSAGDTIRFHNWQSGSDSTLELPVDVGKPVRVDFSSDGSLLAVGFDTGEIQVWTASEQRLLYTQSGGSVATSDIAFSPDLRFLAIARQSKQAELLDPSTGQHLGVLHSDSDQVTSVVFSSTGESLLSGAQDRSVDLWPLTNQSISPGVHLGAMSAPVTAVAYAPDDLWVAAGDQQGLVKIWNTQNLQLAASIPAHSEAVTGVIFSPSGQVIASTGDDGQVRLWRIKDGALVASWTFPDQYGGNQSIRCLAFSPDGQVIAIGMLSGEIYFLEIRLKSGD